MAYLDVVMEDSDGSTRSTCSDASHSYRDDSSCLRKVTTGTRGDPRMHQAVAARLANPEISLFEALINGGFLFDSDDATHVDEENVTLGQRKNQLSRRLRLSRQKVHRSPEQSCTGSYGHEKSSKMQRKCTHKKKLSSVELSKCKRNRTVSDFRSIEGSGSSTTNSLPSLITGQESPDVNIMPHCTHSVDEACAPRFDNSSNILDSSQKLNVMDRDESLSSVLKSGASTNDISGLRKALDNLSSALETCREEAQRISSIDKMSFNYSREDLAIGLYQADNRALYQRAMLLAGYQSDLALTETTSPDYLRFALACWLSEGIRLQNVIDIQRKLHASEEASKVTPSESDADPELIQESTNNNCATKHHCAMDVCDGHMHNHVNLFSPKADCLDELTDCYDALSEETPVVMHHGSGCPLAAGRHVHRLEGKCGHKAILHIPENGPAHIDFVVGNKVECYQGMPPPSYQNSLGRAIWPSGYKCDDVSCAGLCSEETLTSHKPPESCSHAVDPKVFNLDEIDMESKEWNLEFPFDESLIGLFKLGDSTDI